ncbi:MAG: agglutinin biogenesis protein MshI [Sulfuriferula sp.]
MGIFSRNKKSQSLLVFELQTDGVCVTQVAHSKGNKPQVLLAKFYPLAQTETSAVLTRINKELRVKNYQCGHLLSTGEYQLLTVETPNVPAPELKTAVRWLLKDMLDYHVDDATIDVLDIPVDKNAPARKAMMFVIAARNQLIEQRQALFENANNNLSVIDIPDLAQRNIANLIATTERGLALLSFDNNGGLLTISYQGELYLSRRLDINLTQLGTLDSELKTRLFEKITLELQRSFDHIERQYQFLNLEKLVLTPALPELIELTEFLSSNLYIPVSCIALDTLFGLTPELQTPTQQSRFFMSLGAALRLEEKTL